MIAAWLLDDADVPSRPLVAREFRAWREAGSVPAFQYHPLGFLYAKVQSAGSVGIRLHVWSKEARVQEPQWNVHDHLFDFSSVVLFGSIRNERFAFEKALGGEAGLFQVAYDGADSVLTSLGQSGTLRPVGAETALEGAVYRLKSTELHNSSPIGTWAATIVRTEQRRTDGAVVIGSSEHPKEVRYVREAVGDKTSALIFARIIDSMNGLAVPPATE